MFLSLLVSALAVVFHRKYTASISVAATADKRLLLSWSGLGNSNVLMHQAQYTCKTL